MSEKRAEAVTHNKGRREPRVDVDSASLSRRRYVGVDIVSMINGEQRADLDAA